MPTSSFEETMLTEGVDALVARVPNGGERLCQPIVRSHTTAEDAGGIAVEAGVARTTLIDFVPDGNPGYGAEKWQELVRKTWHGPLSIGLVGLIIELWAAPVVQRPADALEACFR